MIAVRHILAAIIQAAREIVAEATLVGSFSPPPELVTRAIIGVRMSVLQLEVGQTAVGRLMFNEPTPPSDGMVSSDDPAVATIALAADMETWTCMAMSVGVANMSYTGTSAAPDAGPAEVPNMVVTVIAVPPHEQGDFDPSGAAITGP